MPDPQPRIASSSGPILGVAEAVATANVSGPTKAASSGASRSRKPFKPGVFMMQGRQTVKGYSITKDQLDNLTHLGWLTTSCLSFASGLLGFAINLQSTIDLSADAPPKNLEWWSGINFAAVIAAFALYAIGGVLFFRGQNQKKRIEDNTEFEEH